MGEKKFINTLWVLFLISVSSCGSNNHYIERDFSSFFDDKNSDGCVVIYDYNKGEYSVYNEERSETRFSPASTFKIYNSLFALEAGVAPDKEFELEWDYTKYYYESWNKNHNLESAIQNSVVWYFQEVARRIGKDEMQGHLNKIGYGNKSSSPAIDEFWLNGGLKISAKEQVELLVKLYKLELPYSKNNQKIVKEMIMLENNSGYSLSGKTGIYTSGNNFLGWFIGYVETGNNVYFFATNLSKKVTDFAENLGDATMVTKQILKELNIMN